MKKTNYIIYGFKASGKSTYAREFSSKNSFKLIDTDEELLKKHSFKSIYDFYKTNSDKFRESEYEIFKEIIKSVKNNSVISVGGSTLLHDEINMENLKNKFIFILIDTDFETIYRRIKKQKSIYNGYSHDELKKIYNKRIQIFRQWADKSIKFF